ncbi:hypothetical protein MMC11_007614 [Xylographa trunciseda]|nr:hypothetical protein [Xylographa trunciseda]
MEPYTLPEVRSLITSIFDSLPTTATISSPSPSNPLLTATDSTKSLFLTLHCLFPTELLPSLDLLDRGLVSRLVYRLTAVVRPPAHRRSEEPTEAQPSGIDARTIEAKDIKTYYVRSAQPTRATSRYQNVPGSATSYEVRLDAWNCSCAAFTFSAFTGVGVSSQGRENGIGMTEEEEPWFGSLLRGDDSMPVCKHLLACVLVEKCAQFRGFVEERIVGKEEAAGWGAGWGG